MEKNKE